MAANQTASEELRCFRCGFAAPSDSEWKTIEHPPLGTLTQCPECNSTDIRHRV